MSASEDWDRALATLALPVEPYSGLTLDEAVTFAITEKCALEDVTGLDAVTLDLLPQRVRVRLDAFGLVEVAHRG